MLSNQPGDRGAPAASVPRIGGNFTRRRRPHLIPFLLLALLAVLMTACAPGEAPPPAVCDFYERLMFTTLLLGGAVVILGIALIGLKKNISAIMPSQAVQMGTGALSIFIGIAMMAFSVDIGNQILAAAGIESLYILCGL